MFWVVDYIIKMEWAMEAHPPSRESVVHTHTPIVYGTPKPLNVTPKIRSLPNIYLRCVPADSPPTQCRDKSSKFSIKKYYLEYSSPIRKTVNKSPKTTRRNHHPKSIETDIQSRFPPKNMYHRTRITFSRKILYRRKIQHIQCSKTKYFSSR